MTVRANKLKQFKMSAGKDNLKADEFRSQGNLLYQRSKFREALICYNKSLCFSTPKSPTLALAYANRSAVYLELKKFDHCLENIQLAREHKYAHGRKLKEREEKCHELKRSHPPDPENDPSSFWKLSYPANEKIPFIVNCLELRKDQKYGYHIVTNQDLNPGDVIAIEEMPFPTIFTHGIYKRCTCCLKSNVLNLIPCDGCSNGNTEDAAT